ncbi:MAG: HEPN domain-containing protein [bacterium]
MTDKETLFLYRLNQAEETLIEAEKMITNNFSPRTIINRAYYSMFYALLALFLKTDINIKTSKHIGIISLFDKEFIKTEKIDKRYSKILHNTFDSRQEGDYKEFANQSFDDAIDIINQSKEFLEIIKKQCNGF